MTMYTEGINPKTKKELKDLIASGKKIRVVSLSPMGDRILEAGDSVDNLCGPKYPQPHKWYAEGKLDEDGYLKSIK
jgi:hypothetical protein